MDNSEAIDVKHIESEENESLLHRILDALDDDDLARLIYLLGYKMPYVIGTFLREVEGRARD